MDVKYIGGDAPWTLPFGDHYYSSSHASFTDSHKRSLTSAKDLEIIARRHDFEPLYCTTDKKQSQTKPSISNGNLQWMNAGVLFTDKTIESDLTGIYQTDFHDDHGHTFCYLCSINAHHHERTKPRDQSKRRKLIPYNNPKALRIRSSSLDRNVQEPSTANLVPYRFIVRTDTKKNSGTRAQVFLYMYGTENNWTSVNLRARSSASSDGFPSGSIRTFCLRGPDIGQLEQLNINLVGARSDKEWFLKEIEITNLNTSVSWLCEFNCWLPKKDEGDHHHHQHQIKPTVKRQSELSFDNLSVYILQVRTGGKPFAGTDSSIQVEIRGSTSHTRRLTLSTNRANLFEQNQLDTFAIVGWDIGDLSELTVESDKTQLAADWDIKEMTMWKIIPRDDHKQVQVYFPFNTWLGGKVSTLKAKGEIYQSTDHHLRGPTCYHVAIKTGKDLGAGTDANVFLIIYGKSGRTVRHHLDNRSKNDFERDTTSEFTIMDIDVGEINQIKLWHDDSGAGSAWLLDSVIIRKKHSTCRPITNVFSQRLEQISKALYRQVREQMKKNFKVRTSSPSTKENEHRSSDRRSSKFQDYEDNDRLGSARSILRSPVVYDKANSKKNVTWGEHNTDETFSTDAQRMKPKQKRIDQTHQKEDSTQIESGHFDHQSYWISSHSYADNKWMIKSIEESNSFDLDESTRSLLLADRLTTSSKIKIPIREKDDDVYEFEAKRWLDKSKKDGKLEVYLKPKSTQLSTHTSSETQSKTSEKKHTSPTSKTSADSQHKKYDDDDFPKRSSHFDPGPPGRPTRSLASLDTPKPQYSDSRVQDRSGPSKHRVESPLDKHPRTPSPTQLIKSPRDKNDFITSLTNDKDLLARISREPPYHLRSSTASVLDPRSSSGASSAKPKSSTHSAHELSAHTHPSHV